MGEGVSSRGNIQKFLFVFGIHAFVLTCVLCVVYSAKGDFLYVVQFSILSEDIHCHIR